MVTYALDVDNTRVQSAMEELGVSQEELVSKNFEDFADPHITPDIQLLRYEHHSKLLKSTVYEIKEKIKNRNLESSPSDHPNFNHFLPHSSQSSKSVLQLTKYPFKQRALLESTLSTFNPSKTSNHKRLDSHKSDQEHSSETPNPKNFKDKIEQFKNLQLENLKKLKSDQFKSQQLLLQRNEKMMESHLKREKSLEERQKMKARAKEENFQRKLEEIQMRKTIYEASLEDDITEKLNFFENRLRKSQEIYNEALKDKIEKASKFKERAEIVQRNLELMKKTNEIEIFRRLVDKHENVKNHRERIDERIQQLAQTKREKFDKHRSEALEKIKKAELDFIKKSKSTEKQLITAQKNVSQRKMQIKHEMLLRKELKRLKDLECLIKIKRAKKRFEAKNSKNLQKTLEKYQKIDELKQEREKIIYNNRDSAIKAMIEKEKFLEAVAIICKSPRSKTSKEKLKALNFKSKESSVSEVKDN